MLQEDSEGDTEVTKAFRKKQVSSDSVDPSTKAEPYVKGAFLIYHLEQVIEMCGEYSLSQLFLSDCPN
jgi:hypothetical protein